MGHKKFRHRPRDVRGRFVPYARRGVRKAVNPRSKRNVILNKGVSLIPDVYMTKMKYTKVVRSTDQMIEQPQITSHKVYSIKMSGNSVYDPDDTTILNNWPVGYNEFRALYERFYVKGSRCRVTNIAVGGDLTMGYRTIVLPSNRDSIEQIPFNSLVSNPYSGKLKYFGPAFGKNIAKAYCGMTTRAITGRSKPVAEDNYHGKMGTVLTGGDPEVQWWYHIIYQSTNEEFDDSSPFEITIEVEYDVMFYARRMQIQDSPITLGPLDEEVLEENSGPPNGPP